MFVRWCHLILAPGFVFLVCVFLLMMRAVRAGWDGKVEVVRP